MFTQSLSKMLKFTPKKQPATCQSLIQTPMKHTAQQWSFEPLTYSFLQISISANSQFAIGFCGGGFLLWFADTRPETANQLALFLLVFGIIWLISKKWTIWQWYQKNEETIYLDNKGLHFCIYPRSGSLQYTDITKAVHWYVERADNRRRYDKDIGIIITTQQGEHIYLNLERMIQSNDGISFSTNSSVVIQELNKRMKAA